MAATTLSQLQRRAADWKNRKRLRMESNLGLHLNPYSNHRPTVLDPLGVGHPGIRAPGSVQYGTMPNATQMNAMIGPTPFDAAMMRQRRGTNVGGGGRRDGAATTSSLAPMDAGTGEPTGDEIFQNFLASAISERDAANAANIARYDEAKKLTTELGQRNQDRVKNWGIAASEDIDERMKESLGNQQAYLASRGLSNSTIMPAFMERSARDTAREQQRISEMRDQRASEYDTRDTTALAGIIERREDVAPSLEFLTQLAMQFGQSGDGEGLAAVQEEIADLRRAVADGGRRDQRGFDPYAGYYDFPRYGQQGAAPIFLGANALTGGFPIGLPAFGGGLPQRQPAVPLITDGRHDFSGLDKGAPAVAEPRRERRANDGMAVYRDGAYFVNGRRYTPDQWRRAQQARMGAGLGPLQYITN